MSSLGHSHNFLLLIKNGNTMVHKPETNIGTELHTKAEKELMQSLNADLGKKDPENAEELLKELEKEIKNDK